MAKKPTYEELEQKVKDLEKDAAKHKKTEEALRESEERYRTIFDSIEEAYFEVDIGGNFTFFNDSLSKSLGYSNDELMGMNNRDFMPPESYNKIYNLFNQMYITGNPIKKGTYEIIKKDGSRGFHEMSASLMKDQAGQPIGFRGIAHDITARMKAGEALRESEARFRQLFYEMKDGLAVYEAIDGGKDFVFRDINPAGERIGNVKKSEIIGKSLYEIRPNIDEFGLVDVLRSVWQTGKAEHHTERFYKDEELQGWFDNYVYKLESGEVVALFADNTARRMAEEALRESETQYRILFEQMTQGAFRQRADGRLIDVNPAGLKMFGLTRDEFLGRTSETPVWDVVHEDGSPFSGPEHPSMVALRTGKPVSGVVLGVLNEETQERVWMEINAIPEFRPGESNPYQVMVTMHDLTDYKQAQVELKESEDKFRSFAEQSLVGIYLISGDVFKYVNPKFAEIFGYSVDECLDNMHFPQLVHPEDLATVQKQVGRRLSGETKAVRYSFRGIKKSGETIHVEIFGSSMLLKGKSVATGTMLEITDRKRAQEALLNQTYFLQKAQEIGQIGTWELDIKKNELLWTDETYRIFGLPIGTKLTYETFLNCVHPDDRKYVDKEWKAAFDKKPYDIEHRLLVDDDVKWVREKAKLQFNEKDECIRGTGFTQDITESKRAEKEKKKLETKLQRAQKMEAMGLMAGGVAHDLNNILSGIVSYPELLLMDLPEDSPLRKPIKTIQESGMKAADVVEDLLTIARGVATGKEVLNLNTIVTEYLESPEYQKLDKTHSFVNFETELDPTLLNMSGSPTHIKKTLMNLAVNASEAIEGAGTVTILTMNRYLDEPLKGYADARTGEYAVLSVSDDGSGIAPKDLEKIFEPFYTKKVMGRSGTGLGLAVVWNTVQDHNGYINVESSEKGTVFELYFPVTREEVAAEGEEVLLEDYLGHGEKILVVDDEERQRVIACGILTKLGYTAEAVSSGEEAIEYMKENVVDLIVLDMVMPKGINGRETYEEIIKIRPGQKAIIASGYAKTKEVDIAQGLGAGKYIKKPYILQNIGIAVKEELEK